MMIVRHIEITLTFESEQESISGMMPQRASSLENAIEDVVISAIRRELKGSVKNTHARIVPFLLLENEDDSEEDM